MEEMLQSSLPSLEDATPEELAHAIFDVLDAKKAQNIKVLRVHDQTVITDYFVICTGNSGTQVKSLGGEVEYKMELRGVDPLHFEGRDNKAKELIDFIWSEGRTPLSIISREESADILDNIGVPTPPVKQPQLEEEEDDKPKKRRTKKK